MTRPDILHCVHEPFGDAFYYGPERLSPRFENDEDGRQKSGFADVTYKDVVDALEKDIEDNKVRFRPPKETIPSPSPFAAWGLWGLPSYIRPILLRSQPQRKCQADRATQSEQVSR